MLPQKAECYYPAGCSLKAFISPVSQTVMAYGLGAGDVTPGSSSAANAENLWHFCPRVCSLPVYVYFLLKLT